MAMQYFKLHYDLNKMFKSVSDEQLGQGIRALLIYANGGKPPDNLNLGAQIVFDALSAQMDRDNAAYEAKCEKLRQNQLKRWKKEKGKGIQTNTNVYKSMQEKEEEKEEENINNNILSASDDAQCAHNAPLDAHNEHQEGHIEPNRVHTKNRIDAHFDEMWALYPNKKGKARVSDARRKKLMDISLEEMTRAIDRYKTELKKDEWRTPQNGSTFFNSGYVDYLDANYQEGDGLEKTRSDREAEPADKDYRANPCGLQFAD